MNFWPLFVNVLPTFRKLSLRSSTRSRDVGEAGWLHGPPMQAIWLESPEKSTSFDSSTAEACKQDGSIAKPDAALRVGR